MKMALFMVITPGKLQRKSFMIKTLIQIA